MKFTIEINSVTDSLDEAPRQELHRVLAVISKELGYGSEGGIIKDSDGVLIGSWSINS